MFKVYRMPEKGEFYIIGGDCSQGGSDKNEAHFLSYDNLDFPIVYRSHGVALKMTNAIFPMLEWIYDKTGIKPVVAFERNMGGASEMERLVDLNRNHKYKVYVMPRIGMSEGDDYTDQYGWTTTSISRPKLLGDWKNAFDSKLIRIYDEETINEHKTFVVNRHDRPEASTGTHDDAVIAPAIAWQLYQTEKPPMKTVIKPYKRGRYTIG